MYFGIKYTVQHCVPLKNTEWLWHQACFRVSCTVFHHRIQTDCETRCTLGYSTLCSTTGYREIVRPGVFGVLCTVFHHRILRDYETRCIWGMLHCVPPQNTNRLWDQVSVGDAALCSTTEYWEIVRPGAFWGPLYCVPPQNTERLSDQVYLGYSALCSATEYWEFMRPGVFGVSCTVFHYRILRDYETRCIWGMLHCVPPQNTERVRPGVFRGMLHCVPPQNTERLWDQVHFGVLCTVFHHRIPRDCKTRCILGSSALWSTTEYWDQVYLEYSAMCSTTEYWEIMRPGVFGVLCTVFHHRILREYETRCFWGMLYCVPPDYETRYT